MSDEDRPPAGTRCITCNAGGHFCQATMYVVGSDGHLCAVLRRRDWPTFSRMRTRLADDGLPLLPEPKMARNEAVYAPRAIDAQGRKRMPVFVQTRRTRRSGITYLKICWRSRLGESLALEALNSGFSKESLRRGPFRQATCYLRKSRTFPSPEFSFPNLLRAMISLSSGAQNHGHWRDLQQAKACGR